ncbi:unnamed protein product [Rhizopus stolonifer]
MSSRKRSNSIIPIEFIKDETNGGMERAALATVFGVKEYTESKIFWNHNDTMPEIRPKESLSLPLIPIVSEFGDLWPNDVSKETIENENTLHPLDLSGYPTILFDIVKPDSSPCITWQNVSIRPHETTNITTTSKKRSRWSTELFSNKKQEHVLNEQEKEPQRQIETATLEKLVEKLTVSLDYAFMTDFFLIYRIFTTPVQLLKYLILRYKWSLEKESEERYIVRIRTFVVIRHWLLNYFLHDFVPDKELRSILTKFLNDMSLNLTVKKSARDQRIIQSLKRVVQRLKKIYYTSRTPVQVIEPPPPTFEQERVKAIIKDSLGKSTIRQRFNGIHVDARHGANTAIRDQKTAQVLLIGSTRYDSSFSPQRSLNQSTSSLPANHTNQDEKFGEDSCMSFETDLTPGNSDAEDEILDEELSQKLSEMDLGPERPSSVISLPLQQQEKFEYAKRTRSFYNAQLAIPVLATPSNESVHPENTANDYFQSRMQTKKQEDKKMALPDRLNKPLPMISTDSSPEPSIQSDSSFKDSLAREHWKLSIRNRGSEKSLKSRITEIDINQYVPSKPVSSLKPIYQSILLSYPTSVIVEQFCLIEKSVLLDINWEELVDIRWTKMPAGQYLQYEFQINDDLGGGNITNSQPGIYSRTKRMRQQQERAQDGSERGIEKAIHRFNAVCQWVSSEIVQTKSIELRAKLIEKFIRLAKRSMQHLV